MDLPQILHKTDHPLNEPLCLGIDPGCESGKYTPNKQSDQSKTTARIRAPAILISTLTKQWHSVPLYYTKLKTVTFSAFDLIPI